MPNRATATSAMPASKPRAPPASRRPPPPPELSPPEPSPPAITTKAFWPLMDRWGVPDEVALRLIGHPGGLTSTGKRPRFTLTPDEVRRLGYLREIGTSLELMFGEAGDWLKQRTSALPFHGMTPLDYMATRGNAGIQEVLRFLARFGMRQALRN